MSNVKVLTGRIGSLSYKFAKENDIALMPTNIIKGDEIIRDDTDKKASEFFKELPTLSDIPSTSAPPQGEVLKFLKENVKKCESALYLSASTKLSAIYDSVSNAAAKLKKEGYDIKVFDTLTTLSMQGMFAYQARLLSNGGDNREEIVKKLTKMRDEVRIREYGTIETLKYLEKNGRIGKAKAWIANLFSFKPIISAKDGELDPVGRARSNDQALEITVKKIHEDQERVGSSEMDMMYDYGLSDKYLKEAVIPRMEKEFHPKVISRNQISIVISCHLGPEVWGVCPYHK
jgi:DegV family protein with EDD domain